MRVLFQNVAQALAFLGGLHANKPPGIAMDWPYITGLPGKPVLEVEVISNSRVSVRSSAQAPTVAVYCAQDLDIVVNRALGMIVGHHHQEVRMSIGRTAVVERTSIVVGCKTFRDADIPKLKAAAGRLKRGLKFSPFTTSHGHLIRPAANRSLYVDNDATVPHADVTLVLDAKAKLMASPASQPFRLF